MDDAITKFNNEMPLTENLVFNIVILNWWKTILILWSCFDTICILQICVYTKGIQMFFKQLNIF